jgi:hypothetical protein
LYRTLSFRRKLLYPVDARSDAKVSYGMTMRTHEEKSAELKPILTDAQYADYQKYVKKMRAKFSRSQ